jgi:DNA polymerase-3 subunit epsilon
MIMRQVFLDTETTGLDPAQGHRIIEIAAVEVVNRRLTGNHFHAYLNPDREIDIGAQQVHGISLEFLQDKPHFKDVAAEFLDFIREAGLVIHNAPFDLGFLNNELGLIELSTVESVSTGIIDTLKMAKEMHPGQRNNLDALCKRYSVDNSARTLHGALLDAELLADVYMAMTRGQESLTMEMSTPAEMSQTTTFDRQQPLKVVTANEEESTAHEAYLQGLSNALWNGMASH